MVKEFLVEAYDQLDRVDIDLVKLEAEPRDAERIASVFRALHTIKGTCGFLNFHRLESLTHSAENLLGLLRDGKLVLTTEMTTCLLQAVDASRAMLREIEKSGQDSGDDISELITWIENLQKPRSSPPREDKQDVPHFVPTLGALLMSEGKTTPSSVQKAVELQASGDKRRLGEILIEAGEVKAQDIEIALSRQNEAKANVQDNQIRVDVKLLDKLMNLVGELVLARNQVHQFTREYQDVTFVNTAQRLSLITSELQEGVMKTRMQPVSAVWKKFPRVVRQLGIVCNKRVRVEMEGGETELDSTIIEAIRDPLTHVLRNAVDHGIEPAEVRASHNKSPEGVIRLRAFHEGGQVNLEISDDGKGIDHEICRAKAVERGLMTQHQASALSRREALEIIFRPGFSTAAAITNISGRGVGMDVVKTNIEEIGGTVEVDSRVGVGTTLKIRIPLTLAIIPTLIVTSGGRPFAIPQVNLLELVRLEAESVAHSVTTIHGAPVFRLRGELVPLVYLADALGDERPALSGEPANIVVLQADHRIFGVVVEAILDTAEIVVKPLSQHLKRIATYAGATILGDGTVALILDVVGLAQQAGLLQDRENMLGNNQGTSQRENRTKTDRYLLFRVGEDRRLAIPLSSVARLEELPRHRIERAGELNVVQYRGRILPLLDLAQELRAKRAPGVAELARVLVFEDGERCIGMEVAGIIDIVDGANSLDRTFGGDGVIGSMVLQGLVTEVLDVEQMLAKVSSHWTSEPLAALAA
jgi:two-component system chemotaxis sensor kinase CheA